jgi:hypothetical protein
MESVDGGTKFLIIGKSTGVGASWDEITKAINLCISHAFSSQSIYFMTFLLFV